jgi:hypothetical protein
VRLRYDARVRLASRAALFLTAWALAAPVAAERPEGAPVVARWNGFWIEATIASATASRATVRIPATGQKAGLAANDVMSWPPEGGDVNASPGDLVLVRYGPLWLPRRLKSATESAVTVQHHGPQVEASCTPCVLVPSEHWRPAVQAEWDAAAARGLPPPGLSLEPRGVGVRVKAGDVVLFSARAPAATWSQGRVRSVSAGKVAILAVDGNGAEGERAVDAALVAAAPSTRRPARVSVGEMVLHRRVSDARATTWTACRVERTLGKSIVCTDDEGRTSFDVPGTYAAAAPPASSTHD